MDYTRVIAALRKELRRVDETIKALDTLERQQERAQVIPKRGRKAMGAAERLEVSERMKRYWATRKRPAPEVNGANPANGTTG